MYIWKLSPCHYLFIPSSWAQVSQRWRKRCVCLPGWPWRWVSLHRAHCGCPPWPSEADAARGCCPLRAARQHNIWGCGEAPHDHRDLLSEAGRRGREGQSKVEEADYGEESTWREGEEEQLEGNVRRIWEWFMNLSARFSCPVGIVWHMWVCVNLETDPGDYWN